jgi:hypothetical protein
VVHHPHHPSNTKLRNGAGPNRMVHDMADQTIEAPIPNNSWNMRSSSTPTKTESSAATNWWNSLGTCHHPLLQVNPEAACSAADPKRADQDHAGQKDAGRKDAGQVLADLKVADLKQADQDRVGQKVGGQKDVGQVLADLRVADLKQADQDRVDPKDGDQMVVGQDQADQADQKAVAPRVTPQNV